MCIFLIVFDVFRAGGVGMGAGPIGMRPRRAVASSLGIIVVTWYRAEAVDALRAFPLPTTA